MVAPWSFVCGMFKARSILCSVEVAEALAVSNGLSFAADVGEERLKDHSGHHSSRFGQLFQAQVLL